MRKTNKLILFFLALLLLGQSLAASEEGLGGNAATDTEASTLLNGSIEHITEALLGRRYVGGPLGEGSSGLHDNDPRYRLDQFDCTTFVETVLALSLSKSLEQFTVNMDRIRYKNGDVSFLSRNHFPSLDWIPNNSWLLEDITPNFLAETEVRLARAVIDKAAWVLSLTSKEITRPDLNDEQKQALAKQLHAEAKNFSPQTISIAYLPVEALEQNPAVLSKIPSGSIFNIVRENYKPGATAMNVSHQGFVIQQRGVTLIRHASVGTAVKDDVLLPYLVEQKKKKPSVVGINLLFVSEKSRSGPLRTTKAP
ncbi:MAG: N-acetylmuramoyl-L-alanine amidase-like domain-containing protein [Bdellovibrionota bacterium]